MIEASWALDEIEAAWQQILKDGEVSDYGIDYRHADPFYSPDMRDRD